MWLLVPAPRVIAFPPPPDPDVWANPIALILTAQIDCFPVFSVRLDATSTVAAMVDTTPTLTADVSVSPEPL